MFILLFLWALCAIIQSINAAVCSGSLLFSNLTVVTLASAPIGYTSLNDWCAQFGLEFANVFTSDFTNLVLIGLDCGVLEGIAVNSINGIKWAQCFLTENDGFRFPINPGLECAAPVAVACRPPEVVAVTSISTVVFLNFTTVTLISPTVTITDPVTSSRFKTLPCGTSTTTGNLTESFTTRTCTTTTTTVIQTLTCPVRRLHICPTHIADLRLISGSNLSRNARRDQAECACEQDNLELALVSGENLGPAAGVLFGCLGGGSKAWIQYPIVLNSSDIVQPCLAVDDDGVGTIDSCAVDEQLPVMCTGSPICTESSSSCLSSVSCSEKKAPQVLLEQAQQATCTSGNVAIMFPVLFPNIFTACASIAMVPMDWSPGTYDANIIAAATACGFFNFGWVASFNGSVSFCQEVGFNGISIQDTFVMDSSVCAETSLGVWCVASTTNISRSSTGTVTGTATTVTVPTFTTTTLQSVSTVLTPSTTTLTTTVTTIRSLVLTPFTTTTVFTRTTSTTTTIVRTRTVTTTVSSLTTTVSH